MLSDKKKEKKEEEVLRGVYSPFFFFPFLNFPYPPSFLCLLSFLSVFLLLFLETPTDAKKVN